jgi:hypothetical protein
MYGFTFINQDEVDTHIIADTADGLNRSLQVDDPTLENLKGSFELIKKALKDKRGEEEIAYQQGYLGNVDIVEVLTLCSLFNLNKYPNRRTHPYGLFGQRKVVLDTFLADIKSSDSAFGGFCQNCTKFGLSERVQQVLAPEFGTIKKSNRQKGNRIGSEPNKRAGYFLSGELVETAFGIYVPPCCLFSSKCVSRSLEKRTI